MVSIRKKWSTIRDVLNSSALNPDKSDVVTFGTAMRVANLKQSASDAVAGVQIALTEHVRSLDVTFESHLLFD